MATRAASIFFNTRVHQCMKNILAVIDNEEITNSPVVVAYTFGPVVIISVTPALSTFHVSTGSVASYYTGLRSFKGQACDS